MEKLERLSLKKVTKFNLEETRERVCKRQKTSEYGWKKRAYSGICRVGELCLFDITWM